MLPEIRPGEPVGREVVLEDELGKNTLVVRRAGELRSGAGNRAAGGGGDAVAGRAWMR